LLGTAVILGSAAAGADDRDAAAQEIFRAGSAAYERGEFRAAALAFEAAHREAPHAAALYNAGIAWEAAKENGRAADAYEAALGLGGLEAGQDRDARAHLAALERMLARVEVRAPSGALVSLAHAEGRAAPVAVHVQAGAHEVRVTLVDGRALSRGVRVAAAERAVVTIEAPPAIDAPALLPRVAQRPGVPAPAPAPPDEGSLPLRPIGWAALGGGVLIGGAAVALGVAALDQRDAYNASGHRDADARDAAAGLRTWTNVAWVGAGVLALSGVVLLLAAPSGEPVKTSVAGGRVRIVAAGDASGPDRRSRRAVVGEGLPQNGPSRRETTRTPTATDSREAPGRDTSRAAAQVHSHPARRPEGSPLPPEPAGQGAAEIPGRPERE
jgi:hypothetical protein